MQPRCLGRTGLSVPPIALGGGGLCTCAQNRRLGPDHARGPKGRPRPGDLADVLTGGPLDALRMLKDQGKIGHIDVASEEPYSLLPFLAEPDIEVRVSPIGLEPSV